jgi:hypothetical protein
MVISVEYSVASSQRWSIWSLGRGYKFSCVILRYEGSAPKIPNRSRFFLSSEWQKILSIYKYRLYSWASSCSKMRDIKKYKNTPRELFVHRTYKCLYPRKVTLSEKLEKSYSIRCWFTGWIFRNNSVFWRYLMESLWILELGSSRLWIKT